MARKHGLGWVRDMPDHRDIFYSAPDHLLPALPPSADLRGKCPPVYDQGEIGSCTANAIAGALQFARSMDGETPDFVPARLFIYYNERVIEHSVASDAGAQLRDGIKSVSKQGAPPETEWPYEAVPADPHTNLFPPHSPPVTKPPTGAYHDGKAHNAIAYMRVQQSTDQMRACLAEGFPFCFGFQVYSSMWDASGNPVTNLPMPRGNDQPVGGHAVLAVGYDDAAQLFTIRNSWGASVQDKGYFYMPYAYIASSLASDFWTIRRVRT